MKKIIERTSNYLCLAQNSAMPVRKEGYQFFNDLARGTIEELKKYFDCQPDSLKEHAFEYREQQIKTFITLALGKITKNNFLQEFPMERVKKRTKKWEYLGNGFVDYWAATKEVTCFIEVKNEWTRYYPEKKEFTFYKVAAGLLSDAKEQTDQIKDKGAFYNTKHAYSLGLLITPIFAFGEKAEIIRMDATLKEELIRGAKDLGADILAFWRIGNKRLHEYELENGGEVEYFPGVVFWGRMKKVSRKR
ncbi:MAG: hypothetical protein H6566_29555 [Lewinellaceae bacterium]|nr:hypothetical protein [Lewinellaceae bacterium]